MERYQINQHKTAVPTADLDRLLAEHAHLSEQVARCRKVLRRWSAMDADKHFDREQAMSDLAKAIGNAA